MWILVEYVDGKNFDYTLSVTGGGGTCNHNHFNPPGPLPLARPTFSSGLLLFMHAAGGDPFVFLQEVDLPEAAMTVSSPDATSYYGGKRGVTPAGGGPAYGWGTDTQVWDACGVPESWEDHIAGVGYDTDGGSGPAPPGSIDPADAQIGLSIPVTS